MNRKERERKAEENYRRALMRSLSAKKPKPAPTKFSITEVKVEHQPNLSVWDGGGWSTQNYAGLSVFIRNDFSNQWKQVSSVVNLSTAKIATKIKITKKFFESRCVGRSINETLDVEKCYDYSFIKEEK